MLIRLTEAQDPFFAALDARMPEYVHPDATLIMAVPKIAPSRVGPEEALRYPPAHEVRAVPTQATWYTSRARLFFGNLKRFAGPRTCASRPLMTSGV